VLKLVARGQLQPVVHATYGLAQVGQAQKMMEDRKQFGKLIVIP
jgi:NADPH:quinone reductase-like Zn-dependent oxidoreductase